MKSKADGWLFGIAVCFTAVVLFLPVPTLVPSSTLLDSLKQLSWARVLAWFLAAAVFWAFRNRFWPKDTRECRRFSSAVLLILLQSILLRVAYELAAAWNPSSPSWLPHVGWVWFPWFLVPGLTAILIGARFGAFVCFTGPFMLYLLLDPGPWPLVGSFSSGLIGILLLRRSPTRGRVLRAGAAAGSTLGGVALCGYGMQGAGLDKISAALVVPCAIGLLTALLIFAVLPLLEWMLGELSDVSLIEYGTDHPLLDDLRKQAPGTWSHSLNVADLAEKAAVEIGARALFCKTSALYHDIGKLKEPALFAENNDGPSPHDQMKPEESARKIIEHVPYGLELAQKYRLPKPFREIIAEHHGVSLVRFFYAKARELQPDELKSKVDRDSFCYPGPAPSTKESGIIALADAVEAASHSVSLRSQVDLRTFVQKLFADRISEGELAQCPLTLSDLAKVEQAFVAWLKGRNHFRPAYPEATAQSANVAPEGSSAGQLA